MGLGFWNSTVVELGIYVLRLGVSKVFGFGAQKLGYGLS